MNDHMHVDDSAVAAVLAAAAAPAEGPMPGEAEALAAFRSVHSPRRRPRMPRYSEKAKLIAAAVFGGVVVISGAATAATGSLPIVSHGHSHPNPSASHTPDGTDDDQGEDAAEATETETDTEVSDQAGPDELNGKGSEISAFVHGLPQGHKGPAVCALASDGHCHAGEHGQAGADTHGKAGDTHGKNDASHGQNDADVHGKPALPDGDAALPHGQADLTHGKAATAHTHTNHSSTG